MTSEQIEAIAELEHEQWLVWTRSVDKELKRIAYLINQRKVIEAEEVLYDLRNKWYKNWRPYKELDEKTKDLDRFWAKKVWNLFVSFDTIPLHKFEEQSDYCRHCGKKRVVDAPPFNCMTQEEINEWKEAGGKIQVLPCENGCPE
jgi:hypothetical protein